MLITPQGVALDVTGTVDARRRAGDPARRQAPCSAPGGDGSAVNLTRSNARCTAVGQRASRRRQRRTPSTCRQGPYLMIQAGDHDARSTSRCMGQHLQRRLHLRADHRARPGWPARSSRIGFTRRRAVPRRPAGAASRHASDERRRPGQRRHRGAFMLTPGGVAGSVSGRRLGSTDGAGGRAPVAASPPPLTVQVNTDHQGRDRRSTWTRRTSAIERAAPAPTCAARGHHAVTRRSQHHRRRSSSRRASTTAPTASRRLGTRRHRLDRCSPIAMAGVSLAAERQQHLRRRRAERRRRRAADRPARPGLRAQPQRQDQRQRLPGFSAGQALGGRGEHDPLDLGPVDQGGPGRRDRRPGRRRPPRPTRRLRSAATDVAFDFGGVLEIRGDFSFDSNGDFHGTNLPVFVGKGPSTARTPSAC